MFIADPQYELVAPKRVGRFADTIRKVLVNGLATRFFVQPKVARKFLPEAVEQWGRWRRLEGGDIMILFPNAWTASFVRVCVNYCTVKCFSTLIYLCLNSMNNLSIETSAIKTFRKSSSFKRSSGNYLHPSSSSPFSKSNKGASKCLCCGYSASSRHFTRRSRGAADSIPLTK